jgi:formylmethanofuran dehydrogenase subunit E
MIFENIIRKDNEMMSKKEVFYDENVDYDNLKQSEYDDTPGYTFYTCPKCGGEYLATFMTTYRGETMCIDCWEKKHRK